MSKPEKKLVLNPIDATANIFRAQMPTTLSKREGKFGKAGKKALIEINSHIVKDWPTRTVYQYDVSLPSYLL